MKEKWTMKKILLIVYDNGSYIHYFPMGIARLAAALRYAGHNVHIYQQDKYHYSEEDLVNHIDMNGYDMVGMGVTAGYYQLKKLRAVGLALTTCKKKPFFIIGGHGPSAAHEFYTYKTFCDHVIVGEGEEAIVHIANNLDYYIEHPMLDYLNWGECDNLDDLQHPAYDMFDMDYYALFRYPGMKKTDRVGFIETSRGCPYKCNFCYRMMKGIRFHSIDYIRQDVENLINNYGINYFVFTDELVMASKERILDICELMENYDVKWWCNGRLNFAVEDIMWILDDSGCVFINYGIESLNDEVLETMNKSLTFDKIERGIKATLAAGIDVGMNLIWGNIGEIEADLKNAENFLLKYGRGKELRTIRPVTPYPGTELFDYCVKEGHIKDVEDFYDKHKNSDLFTVNLTPYNDSTAHEMLLTTNSNLIRAYYDKRKLKAVSEAIGLYRYKDTTFRGFRQT